MRIAAIVACLALLLTPACTGGEPTPAEAGVTFRVRLNDDPPDMDPVRSRDTTSEAVLFKIFDGLVEFDPTTLEVAPAVAESWEISPDGLTYTFHIRPNVRFHNGREVTASDAVYSFERALRPESRPARPWVFGPVLGSEAFREGEADRVAGLEAVDPRTLRVTLTHSYAPFLSHLLVEQASLVPREIYDDPDEGYLRHPVGCGPFRFASWTPGQSVVLEAFPDYYGEGPHVDRVVFRIMHSQETALQEYRAGNLEMTDEIPSGIRRELQEEFGEQYRRWPQIAVRSFALNHARPPFAGNLALRQAVNHAVDRDYILRVVDEGKDMPVAGVIPPGLPSHNPELEGYAHDPARARALLARAGYPAGEGLPELTLVYNTNEGHRRMCERVVADLAEVGIRARLLNLDFAAYLAAITGTPDEPPEAHMIYFAWVADFPDAYNFLFTNLHSSNAGAGGNYSRYVNPEFDRLIDQAVGEPDTARRIDLYRRAERVAVEDAAWIFFYSFGEEALVRPEVEGLVLSPLGDFDIPFNRIRLVERASD